MGKISEKQKLVHQNSKKVSSSFCINRLENCQFFCVDRFSYNLFCLKQILSTIHLNNYFTSNKEKRICTIFPTKDGNEFVFFKVEGIVYSTKFKKLYDAFFNFNKTLFMKLKKCLISYYFDNKINNDSFMKNIKIYYV